MSCFFGEFNSGSDDFFNIVRIMQPVGTECVGIEYIAAGIQVAFV